MEHVYRINLNKGEDKAARIAQQLELQRWGLLVFLLLIAGGMAWFTWDRNVQLDDMIQHKVEQIVDVKQQLQELRDTGAKLSKRDILSLARLENSRLLWTRKLMGLGMEVNREMALTAVRFEKGFLYITGVYKIREGGDPLDQVMIFVEQLRANELFNENFDNVYFASSQDIVTQDQPALLFELRCKIQSRFLSKTVDFGRDT